MSSLNALDRQFLRSSGWHRSVTLSAAVDNDGPVPWFTYPAIRFLKRIVRPAWRVLEYGSGNSTRWWAHRTAQTVSVEHDPSWANALRADLPANVELIERVMDDPVPVGCDELLRREYFASGCTGLETADPTRNYRAGLLDAAYAGYAAVGLEYPAGHFDVIVVDGMARAMCTWVAARQVADDGIIVFDNADRDEYAQAYAWLEGRGFARIDFWGLGPINPYEWCTSVFVRSLRPLRVSAA